jgi:hypothetical protein
VLECRRVTSKKAPKSDGKAVYRVVLSAEGVDPLRLAAFQSAPDWVVTRRRGKGKLKKNDLKDMVFQIRLSHPDTIEMVLASEPGRMLRPADVLEHVFSLNQEAIRQARIVKIDPERDPGNTDV